MKAETILRRALKAQEQIEQAQATLNECQEQALKLFEKVKAKEEIVTPLGVLTYNRKTRWSVMQELLAEGRGDISAEDFDRIWESKVKRYVPESLMDDLAFDLGSMSSDYIAESVTFSLKKSIQNLAKTDPEHPDFELALQYTNVDISEGVDFREVGT